MRFAISVSVVAVATYLLLSPSLTHPTAEEGGLEMCITRTGECVDLWELQKKVNALTP